MQPTLTVVSGDMTSPGDEQTQQLLDHWRTWMRAQSWSHRTIDERIALIVRVSSQVGMPAELLDTDQVLGFLAGPFSASSRQTYHVNLNSWFRWLVAEGIRDDDPMQGLKIPRASRRPPRPIATAHLERLLSARMHRRTRTMILLAAYAGLRVSEIAKFRGSDIDPLAKELHVLGKGDVAAVLPLSPVIEKEAAMYGPGWWFPQWKENRHGRAGGHILGRSVSTIIANAMRRAGVPGSAHSLRHWFASQMLREGVDIRVIQQLMRHASLATTERYLHVDDTQRRAGVLRLPDVTLVEAEPMLPIAA